MDKCKECGSFIYESRRYRELKKTLINLDKRYENVVDDVCQQCLVREQNKIISGAFVKKVSEILSKRAGEQ